jgi:RND family efflux transporter MFP subunit
MKNISIILLAITILFASCGESTSPESAQTERSAKKVETAPVKTIEYQESIFATGKLSSKEEAKLSFKTGGIIKRIYVREGQSVKKGQLLAELEMDEIRAQTQQAELGKQQSAITIENAKLALQLAERDYKNALGLYQDSVATLEQLENAEVQLNNAKNQLEAAQTGLSFSEQNVEVANFNLRHSKIVAPAKGIILKKLAETNELVGPGTPVFLFGSKEKAQVVKVNITDKDIIHVALDNDAKINFDAYPDTDFQGAVKEIASMADPYTNTYEVEIEVKPDGKRLLSGFIGSVTIFTKEKEQMFEIPVDALISANEKKGSVFVVDSGKAVKTLVGIYKVEGEGLLINNGLTGEDEVIISGVGYLENNDPVLISKK